MQNVVKILALLLAIQSSSAALAQGGQQLTDKEKAKILEQVDSLKRSKLQNGTDAYNTTKQDALRQGEDIDKRVQQYSEKVDQAVENYSPRWGPAAANSVGEAKKKEAEALGKAAKAKIAKQARKKGAEQLSASQKAADNIDQSVAGLKSQVSKSGKFGLTPKGSSVYVRNYGGK